MSSAGKKSNQVRSGRIQAGLTQAELARLAGVSRTAVTAIEAERLVPSVAAALAIARALGTDVESLFGPSTARSLPEWGIAPPQFPWRACLADVGPRRLLFPVEEVRHSVLEHDLVSGRTVTQRDWPLASRTLVIATCDPAASLLSVHYAARTGFRMLVLHRSSRQALELLAQGIVHAAGIHLSSPNEPEGNRAAAREVIHEPVELIRGADWTSGIATGTGMDGVSLHSLCRPRVRWVSREPGSGARCSQDRLLGGERICQHTAGSHRTVAEMVKLGVADAGICLELVSRETGVRFHPVQQEFYDLCVPLSSQTDPRVQALLTVLRSRDYRRKLGELPGYSTKRTGAVRSV